MNFYDLKKFLKTLISSLGGDVGLYVKFLKSGEEIKINDKKQIDSASVIKILIICEFFRQVFEENLDKNKKVKISKVNRVEGSGIIKLLGKNTELSLIDIATLMIVISDNSATNQLVDILGLNEIQNYIKSLGLTQTTFNHKMMIKSGRGENLTTAYDMSKLLEMLYKKEIKGSSNIVKILEKQQDKGRISLLLPKNLRIANKIGTLEESLHDVGIIYAKNPFVFSFLSDKQKDRTKTKKILSECVLKCYEYSNNKF